MRFETDGYFVHRLFQQSPCALFVFLFALAVGCPVSLMAQSADLNLAIEQITFGPKHHFFGYIGQSQTIPWNASGRYILALRVGFHDHMPEPHEAAEIVLIDTARGNRIVPVGQTRAWNFQQGTMFYWNPASAETQFFFNDRDPRTNKIYIVLFDVQEWKRVHEYRYPDTPIGNSGVVQGGGAFLGINYGRLARLRRVTGYPEAFDWTAGQNAPDNDGIFLVDVRSGEKQLLVSFRELAELVRPWNPDVDKASLYINHTLWNRGDDRIYFFLRGRYKSSSMWVNVPCTIKPDGTGLTVHSTFIGGHPEWAEGYLIIGTEGNRQVLYDVDKKEIVGQLGPPDVFPYPEGDIALSPDGNWFVNGFASEDRKNYYTVLRWSDGAHVRTGSFSRGPYRRGDLRIDPAPRWNRTNDAILVPGWTDDGTRQLFIIRIRENNVNDDETENAASLNTALERAGIRRCGEIVKSLEENRTLAAWHRHRSHGITGGTPVLPSFCQAL